MQSSSFRDPLGTLFLQEKEAIRLIKKEGESSLELAEKLNRLHPRSVIFTTPLSKESLSLDLQSSQEEKNYSLAVSHPRIRFISYPYEWPAQMLWKAGSLTLQLALDLIDLGGELKDASAYNVLFDGTQPVFVDILSFEKRVEGSFVWPAYEQFQSHFVRPLLLLKKKHLSPRAAFLLNSDGLKNEDFFLNKRGSFISKLLSSKMAESLRHQEQKLCRGDDEKARFIQRKIVSGLQRQFNALSFLSGESFWNDYTRTRSHYPQSALEKKEEIVSHFLCESQPSSLLDLGANTGEYSLMAAQKGSFVVALDKDEISINTLYLLAKKKGISLLPLVMDICNPSAALGFANKERASFLERAEKQFDALFFLALLNHLLLANRIPMAKVAELLHRLTLNHLLIEWVGPQDLKVKEFGAWSSDLLGQLTEKRFEEHFSRYFILKKRWKLPEMDRTLYWWVKRC